MRRAHVRTGSGEEHFDQHPNAHRPHFVGPQMQEPPNFAHSRIFRDFAVGRYPPHGWNLGNGSQDWQDLLRLWLGLRTGSSGNPGKLAKPLLHIIECELVQCQIIGLDGYARGFLCAAEFTGTCGDVYPESY